MGDFLDDMGKLWPPPLSWGRRSYGRRRRAVRMRRADLEGQDRGRNGLEDPVERTRIPRLESPSAVDLDNDDDTGKEEKEEEKEEKEAEAEEKKAEEEVGELEERRRKAPSEPTCKNPCPASPRCCPCRLVVELELELIQPHMAQKPVLRGEVGCACVVAGGDRVKDLWRSPEQNRKFEWWWWWGGGYR